jgi:uncharacterized low-complexity protein
MNDMYFMRDTQFPSNLSSSFFSVCHTVDMDTYTHRALRPSSTTEKRGSAGAGRCGSGARRSGRHGLGAGSCGRQPNGLISLKRLLWIL